MNLLTCSHCATRAALGFDGPCIDCDTTPDDPRLHSIGLTWGHGGKEYWHSGPTFREAQTEIFENARRYGIEPERVR